MDFLDAHNGDASPCGCCGFNASRAILNELSVRQLERAVRDYSGLERALRTEDGDAPYVPHEVALTELLAENAAAVADEVEAPLIDALDADYVDEDRVTSAAASVASDWQAKAWPSTLEALVGVTLSGAVLTGAQEVSFGPLLGDLDRLRIINGMIRSAKYATNNYFNTQVMPALIDAVHSAVLNGRANDAGELEAIRALLDRRLRSVPYWNVVANAAASRAYHFGYIKVGVAKGYTTIRYQAIMDSKTSEMCRTLNGTDWYAPDVALLADRIAAAVDVDEVKTITPWLKPSDIADWSPAALLRAGVVIPPIHGRCRSKLVFV